MAEEDVQRILDKLEEVHGDIGQLKGEFKMHDKYDTERFSDLGQRVKAVEINGAVAKKTSAKISTAVSVVVNALVALAASFGGLKQ